jgi:hypothetical protein
MVMMRNWSANRPRTSAHQSNELAWPCSRTRVGLLGCPDISTCRRAPSGRVICSAVTIARFLQGRLGQLRPLEVRSCGLPALDSADERGLQGRGHRDLVHTLITQV